MKTPATLPATASLTPTPTHAVAQADQRPAATVQRQVQQDIERSPRRVAQRQQAALSARPNQTGLPDQLKAGVESLSGHSLDDVKVHYNSGKPAQLQALAYAQGTDIHVGPGQEQHLPHEAWHVVQQKQGRVRPTLSTPDGININDSAHLEAEANTLGNRALQMKAAEPATARATAQSAGEVTQLNGDNQRPSQLTNFLNVFKSIKGMNAQGPLNPTRSRLDTAASQYERPQMFTSGVKTINRGLGTNTDAHLPEDKADKYIADMQSVQSGEMTNTGAFTRSSIDWFGRGDYAGGAANLIGALGAGFLEGHQEKINRYSRKK